MSATDIEILADARARLGALYGWTFTTTEPIGGGRNNRLFRLASADGYAVLVKRYLRDDRRRLQREFGTLQFLRGVVGALVPEPLLEVSDSDYGVYSFEPGTTKEAAELSAAEVEAMAQCAVALHSTAPDDDRCPDFPLAISAGFSIADNLREIEDRLAQFEAEAIDSPLFGVRALDPASVRSEVTELATRALARLSWPGDALPRTHWRLSNADFAPHNILIGAERRGLLGRLGVRRMGRPGPLHPQLRDARSVA